MGFFSPNSIFSVLIFLDIWFNRNVLSKIVVIKWRHETNNLMIILFNDYIIIIITLWSYCCVQQQCIFYILFLVFSLYIVYTVIYLSVLYVILLNYSSKSCRNHRALVTACFRCMEKSSVNILQNFSFCVTGKISKSYGFRMTFLIKWWHHVSSNICLNSFWNRHSL